MIHSFGYISGAAQSRQIGHRSTSSLSSVSTTTTHGKNVSNDGPMTIPQFSHSDPSMTKSKTSFFPARIASSASSITYSARWIMRVRYHKTGPSADSRPLAGLCSLRATRLLYSAPLAGLKSQPINFSSREMRSSSLAIRASNVTSREAPVCFFTSTAGL